MKPLVFFLHGSLSLFKTIPEIYDCEIGSLLIRQFPDGESYIQFQSEVRDRDLIFVATLDHPNQKMIPLLFAAQTAKELGCSKIGLIAPYLAYMRQDKRFKPGEGISSIYFGALLSRYFDWLITIDPHLHRIKNLNEIYSIPTKVLHASPLIGSWIKQHVASPFLIGPDQESEQWVAEIAKEVKAPFVVLHKIRLGDQEVDIKLPDLEAYQKLTPVLIDDVISSGRTLGLVAKLLLKAKFKNPIAVAVHALFAKDSELYLKECGISQVVTCNTIEHPSNLINVSQLIISNLLRVL